GFVKSYQFPALTVSDFVEAEGFYCVSNDYLIKVVEDVMVKGSAAMGEEISDDDVQEKMEIVKNVIVNLNIKLGFKADAYGVNALLLEVKPSHEFLEGMQAPVKNVEVRFELNGLRAFESCTAKAAFTPVNWRDDEGEGAPVAVELGSFTANFSADKNGAHAVVDVAVNMGETPITINGALDYVAGSKCELDVSVVGSGLTYMFNDEAERDQINIYVLFEKKAGGFSLNAAVGIEGYGELIKANAHFYDGAAGEKDFGVTLYVDPTISEILNIPAIDVKVVGTYKEGKITFEKSHIYMPEHDYENSVWVNADRYEVYARVNYTVCIDFEGYIDLHDFLNAKVGADFTLTRTYEDIEVTGNYYDDDNSYSLTDDMIDVITDKYKYDAQRMWIHTENIAGGSKIIAEMQLKMREGEHAGEFDTGMIGYITFTVTDATAEDFLSDDAVAALEHEEGAPTIIDMLLGEIFGGHGSVEPDYPQ
ncbi:MAG: hypothetical protein IJR61_03955, partial [Clostridia bacterium]|nr:hypothetical protein [Clostridia bacterium]